EIGTPRGTAERALDLGLVLPGVFGGESRGEPGIGAKIEDPLARRGVGDMGAARIVKRHLLGEIADAVLGAEALRHLAPAALDELEEAGSASRGGLSVGLEPALLCGRGDEEVEIDGSRGAGLADAAGDRRIDRQRLM